MTLGGLSVAAILTAAALTAADPATSAQQKIDAILANRPAPGSVILFTPAEANAWAQAKLPVLVPQGIRNESLEFSPDVVTGSALVHFIKVRKAMGKDTGAILSKLLEGERPVRATVRVASANGFATLYLTRLQVGSSAVSGTVLNTLIDNVLRPVYPDATINEPIELDYRIERIEIRPAGVRVVIKK